MTVQGSGTINYGNKYSAFIVNDDVNLTIKDVTLANIYAEREGAAVNTLGTTTITNAGQYNVKPSCTITTLINENANTSKDISSSSTTDVKEV